MLHFDSHFWIWRLLKKIFFGGFVFFRYLDHPRAVYNIVITAPMVILPVVFYKAVMVAFVQFKSWWIVNSVMVV